MLMSTFWLILTDNFKKLFLTEILMKQLKYTAQIQIQFNRNRVNKMYL